MKNYYVMNRNSQMLFRGTLDECKRFVDYRTRCFMTAGMRPPGFRVFYDSGTEPILTFNQEEQTV